MMLAAAVRRLRLGSLGLSSALLLTGKAAQMAAGFAFWLVAAQTSMPTAVGLAVATVSAVMLCNQLALLGAGAAIITDLPREAAPRQILDTAFTVVTISSVAVGGGYLLVTAQLSEQLRTVLDQPLYAGLFILTAVLGTAMICLDQVSVAIRHTGQTVLRYLAAGVLPTLLLVTVALTGGRIGAAALFGCWAVGSVVACAAGAIQLRRTLDYRFRPSWRWRQARRLLGVGVPNQLLTLTERLPALLIPVLVAELLSPTRAAYWYPLWMMMWAVYNAPVMVGLVQFAELVHQPSAVRQTVVSALRWSLLLGGAPAVVLVLCAEPLLRLLGEGYAQASTGALPILVLGGLLPYALVQAYNAVCRASGRLTEAVATGVVSAVLSCLATVGGGAVGGETMMALGWTLSITGTAGWVSLRLWRLSTGPARPELVAAGELGR